MIALAQEKKFPFDGDFILEVAQLTSYQAATDALAKFDALIPEEKDKIKSHHGWLRSKAVTVQKLLTLKKKHAV